MGGGVAAASVAFRGRWTQVPSCASPYLGALVAVAPGATGDSFAVFGGRGMFGASSGTDLGLWSVGMGSDSNFSRSSAEVSLE